MVKKLFYFILLIASTSCNIDWLGFVSPTSDTVEQRFSQSIAWNNTHPLPQILTPTDNYSFYVGTDIHTEKTVTNLTRFITDMRNDSAAYFGFLIGDLVNEPDAFHTFARALEFDTLTQLKNDTIFTTVGNHDLYFEQWNDYKTYFGTATYWFEVKTPNFQDLFISLDTGNGTLGISQLKWLREILASKRSNYRHCIVFSHTNLFKQDNSQFPTSNMPIEETLEITDLMQKNKVNLFLQGHDHNREITHYKGVLYIIVDALRDDSDNAFYMIATCSDNVDYKFIAI